MNPESGAKVLPRKMKIWYIAMSYKESKGDGGSLSEERKSERSKKEKEMAKPKRKRQEEKRHACKGLQVACLRDAEHFE